MSADLYSQFHLAAAVFSLSIAIINWTYACNNDTNCASDVSPILNGTAQFEYGAFVGAFGLFDAVVGKTAIFVGAIPPLVTPVLDGLASILYLAGGIVSRTVIPVHTEFMGDVLTQLVESRCMA